MTWKNSPAIIRSAILSRIGGGGGRPPLGGYLDGVIMRGGVYCVVILFRNTWLYLATAKFI